MKRRIVAMAICLVMLVSGMVRTETATTAYAGEIDEDLWIPESPTIWENANGRIVRWDSVWFGSYPQSEVERTDPLYSILEEETDWDDNGDAVVDGSKFRRIKKSDAVNTDSWGYDYEWIDEDTYHYFKYEPIRWRVLDIDSTTATGNILILSDVVLDNQLYHADETKSITWETSTIRSWLNGYSSSENSLAINYKNRNFIDTAFSADEKNLILNTDVANNNNLTGETTGENFTKDKIFLLSKEEICGVKAMSYGFAASSKMEDEARRCGFSIYAKAKGVLFDDFGTPVWWLRSVINDEDGADGSCCSDGTVWDYAPFGWNYYGVRAALKLNLSALNEVCTKADPVQVESTVPGNRFVITYYTNDGDGDDSFLSQQIKEYGVPLTLSTEKPTKMGCTFLGWSTDWDATSPSYEAGGEYTDEKDADLIAVWRANVSEDTLLVTYISNGGTGAPESQVKQKGIALTLSDKKPTRQGYTFLGWSEDSKATEPSYEAGGKYTRNQSVTLYAVWKEGEEKKTVQVSYDANGGTGAPASQLKQEGVDLTLSDIKPVRSGYTFLGWSSDSKAVLPSYQAGGKYTEDQNITLYAVWKQNESGTSVRKISQSIRTSASVYKKSYYSKPFSLRAKSSGDGVLSFTSSNKKVARVSSSGKVSIKGYGTAKITIKASATQRYNAATKRITVKVIPKKVTLKSVKPEKSKQFPSKKMIKISWKGSVTALEYQIQVSTSKKFGKNKTNNLWTKKTFRFVGGYKSNTTCYVRVRVSKDLRGNRCYGEWSKVKKVRIK